MARKRPSSSRKGKSGRQQPTHKEIEKPAVDSEDALELPDDVEEALIHLPEEQRQKVMSFLMVQTIHTGPMPHPDIIKGYKEIIPNAPERIFQQFEKEADHRRKIESKLIAGYNFRGSLNVIVAAIVVLSLATIGTILAFKGYETIALVVFGIDLGGIATAFIVSQRRNQASKENKKK